MAQGPRASSAPALYLNTIIFKYVYWYMKQISGECLQDHWSSGFFSFFKEISLNKHNTKWDYTVCLCPTKGSAGLHDLVTESEQNAVLLYSFFFLFFFSAFCHQ